jgi:dihydroorotase
LREPEDIQALCDALNSGVIDVVATDHAPHALGDKNVEFSEARSGMIGLQFCFSLLLALVNRGQLRIDRLVAALTSGPARVLGWQVPRVATGFRADLVLFDPEAEMEICRATILSKSINTPFLGQRLRGAVDLTMVQGEVVYERTKQGVSQ